MLADYGYIGLLLAVAIFFAVTTLLLPLSLSLPARLVIYFRRFQQYLETRYPFLSKFIPPLPTFPKFMQVVPYKPNPVKSSTFECGMETIGKAWVSLISAIIFMPWCLLPLMSWLSSCIPGRLA